MNRAASNNIRKIFQYKSLDGNCPVECFIDGLTEKQQTKVYGLIALIACEPNALNPPHVKAFRLERYKGLYELRIKLVKLIRIIFYITKEGDIVFLHAFFKKHDRATEQALEISKTRLIQLNLGQATTTNLRKEMQE